QPGSHASLSPHGAVRGVDPGAPGRADTAAPREPGRLVHGTPARGGGRGQAALPCGSTTAVARGRRRRMVIVSQEAAVVAATRPLVFSTDEDRYFDYCLQPYDPLRDPRGKLRSEALLWNSLDLAGAPPSLDAALRAVQAHAGRDMTVVGVKHRQGRIWWELYFYDRLKEDADVRASSIIDAVSPWFHVRPRPRESIPYFMFSFDVHPDTAESGSVDVVNLYLPYYEGQGGRSYK